MTDRRSFLQTAACMPVAAPGFVSAPRDDKKDQEEVGATEDLMREHGVLNRVLLVYEEGLRKLHAKEDIPAAVFRSTAALVRKFIEDYHERLEEEFIFPVFEKQKKHTDLVTVLRKQHDAGRVLTDAILHGAIEDRFKTDAGHKMVVTSCEAFIRMYRPHEAREDTVLFPALRKALPAKEIKDLGERFEKEEDKRFGEGGFEKIVDRVAEIEKQLNIYDLDRFTPKTPKD